MSSVTSCMDCVNSLKKDPKVSGRLPVYDRLVSHLLGIAQGSPARSENILLAGPWGSGKTTILKHIRVCPLVAEKYHVICFSPWETLATEDPCAGFRQFIVDEATALLAQQKKNGNDPEGNKWKRVLSAIVKSPLQAAASSLRESLDGLRQTASAAAKAGAQMLVPMMPPFFTNALGSGIDKFFSLEHMQEIVDAFKPVANGERLPPTLIGQARAAIRSVLKVAAATGGKDRILLLVDDMDRCLPGEAVRMLEGLYHFFLPTRDVLGGDSGESAVLTSLWGVNVPILEEFLYREYRDLPSFHPGAYIEKIFDFRVNVPPVADETEAASLWEADLGGHYFGGDDHARKVLAEKLARSLRYAALSNLRIYSRLRSDCLAYWRSMAPKGGGREPGKDNVRDAQLLALTRLYPGFRETVVLQPSMWPVFMNCLADRYRLFGQAHTHPVLRYFDDPSLMALLEALMAIRFDANQGRYVSDIGGQDQLRQDMVDLMRSGF